MSCGLMDERKKKKLIFVHHKTFQLDSLVTPLTKLFKSPDGLESESLSRLERPGTSSSRSWHPIKRTSSLPVTAAHRDSDNDCDVFPWLPARNGCSDVYWTGTGLAAWTFWSSVLRRAAASESGGSSVRRKSSAKRSKSNFLDDSIKRPCA